MIEINFVNKTDENIESFKTLGIRIINNSYKHMNIKEDKEISYVFLTDDQIQELNKNYRDKDYSTDVLTFPGEDEYLGDIFISIEKVKEQANEFKHSVEIEMSFMFVHGFLHSIGYDHMTDKNHQEMFDLQDEILEME